ncbi:MAG: ABC transporter ATP-binding protein [Pyrinomonadaceae bacterium]|nr:ABC transporter ATP-binding protein [Pyrinomonadaceae bacterium]
MLELRNITKTFGTVVANNDVSIKIQKGTIHAIVGENGAGKSTIMRIAYGFYNADSGEILVDGKPVSIKTPQDAIRLGIGMVHQHFMLVDTMTVGENIILGAEGGNPAAIDWKKANADVLALSNELRLGVSPKALIEDLSVGAQQRVELLKALYRNAELLILDEPTAVLTPQEVEDFFNILRRMRDQGKTIVIITHKLEEVLAISDEVTVMRDGKNVGFVKTADTNARDLARMIVGRDVLLRVEKTEALPKEPVLTVENLSCRNQHGDALNDISFEVRAGEIVGIAGIEGNGQTEVIEAIAGLIPSSKLSGSVRLFGSDISGKTARQRKELGIAHIPEDRHKRGLLLDSDLEENTILGVHYRPPVSSGGFLNSSAIESRTREIIRNFDVRPPKPELAAKSLSGGNQQKLIIGREFELHPKLLLVSQPTRGVDIGAIEFIHRKLIALRDAGTAVLLVSAELEEITALADRLLIIYKGQFVAEVNPKTTSNEEIGLFMTGGRHETAVG